MITNIFFPVIIGWIMGVLINYLSDILPVKRRLSLPFCLNCEASYNLINYSIWPRKCPSCSTARSRRTWIVEVLTIISSVWIWNHPLVKLDYLISLFLLSYLLLVTVIDIERRLILHVVSLVGVLLGFWTGYLLHGFIPTLLGGGAGFLIMLFLYLLGFLFLKLTRKKQKSEVEEEALGFGDVNLGGIIGLVLGWPGILMGIVIAIVIAGCFSLAYLVYVLVKHRYKADLAIPYGPFLTISAVLLLFLRDYFL